MCDKYGFMVIDEADSKDKPKRDKQHWKIAKDSIL
jgi:beta-galactosidase/beta-glucuronidase